MPAKWLPTADYLRECFSYDPASGILTWKTRPLHHFKHEPAQRKWNGRFAGKPAGCPNRDGHTRILVNTGQFTAHRLIWVIQTGRWPKAIDHKNGEPADNRWDNLREATNQQNMWNSRQHDRLLPRGVVPSQRKAGRFMARAVCDGRLIYIGTYNTPELAHEAWCRFVRKERGEFFRAE